GRRPPPPGKTVRAARACAWQRLCSGGRADSPARPSKTRFPEPRMKRFAFFALLGCACVESALNPTDKVTVTGQALNEDKSPLANASIHVQRDGSSTCI